MDTDERIKEITLKYCKDYPKIETYDVFEKLWAIESTLWGINAANEDCHKFIKVLQKRLGMSDTEAFELWTETLSKEEK